MNATCVNERHLALWESLQPADTFGRIPALYGPVVPEALVFVGMNPSFPITDWRYLMRREGTPDIDPESLFAFPRPSPQLSIDAALRLELHAQQHDGLFKQQKALAERLQIGWNHFDIFACRSSDQAAVRSRVVASFEPWRLTESGSQQFRIFEQLLDGTRPKLVILVNALAAHIYGRERKLIRDERTDVFHDETSTRHFPVLVSGMLTGSRALDTLSRERLFRHARHLLVDGTSHFAPSDARSSKPAKGIRVGHDR